VLRERYSATVLQQIVAQNTGLVGPQSFAILVDANGLLLAHGLLPPGRATQALFKPLDPSRSSELHLNRRLPRPPSKESAVESPEMDGPGGAKGGERFFTVRLPIEEGGRQAAAAAQMKTQPWMVVSLQSQDVFLEPVQAQTRNTILLVLGLAAMAAAAAVGVAQLLTAPIVRLTGLARQVADGNVAAKVDVRSTDETGVLADTFNIMTQKLTETLDGLRRSEENYRGIYENALEGIWRVTLNGRVLSANPAMACILGYASPDELIASVSDIRQQVFVDPGERSAVLATYPGKFMRGGGCSASR
jgi:PAS domain-containing protein